MNQTNKKIFLIGVVALTVATVSITAVYIPMVSQDKKTNSNLEVKQKTDEITNYKGSRGSMWNNLDQKIKSSDESRKV